MSAKAKYTEIIYEVSDNIATVTLHRPDKMNAFTGVMMNELLQVFDEIDLDDNVRAVIVTGSGRAFCAGADLSHGADTFSDGKLSGQNPTAVRRDGGGMVTLRMFRCNKPIIGAINGAAGFGITASKRGNQPFVGLTNDEIGGRGNVAGSETVADADFVLTGMASGGGADCPVTIGCNTGNDCASGTCTANACQ